MKEQRVKRQRKKNIQQQKRICKGSCIYDVRKKSKV